VTGMTFYATLLVAWLALYLALPVWLTWRGKLVSAGLIQLVGALLPSIWHSLFWPNEAGSFGLLIIVLAPMPLILILVGLIVLIVRSAKWGFHALSSDHKKT
jgi:hypothetical protein